MPDETEEIRRHQVEQINSILGSRGFLENLHGTVWDTRELQEEFEVLGFLAPYCVVRRRSDGIRGSIMFQHNPRFFFKFEPE